MKLYLLLLLVLISAISSLKLSQIPMPDDNNDGFWDRPGPRIVPESDRRNIIPEEMNTTTRPEILNLTTVTSTNFTNRTEETNTTRTLDERNITRPITEESRNMSRPEEFPDSAVRNFTSTEESRNMSRPGEFPDSAVRNFSSPIVGAHNPALPNVTSNFFQPPFIPMGSFTSQLRVIPPQFWLYSQNNPNAITLNSNDNINALSCKLDGKVTLEPRSRNNSNLIWIPELIGENIVRFRSYNGGILHFNSITNEIACDSRRNDFLSQWAVFLNRDPRTQCMYLAWGNFLLGHQDLKATFENPSADLSKFCWVGDPKNLAAWRTSNTYSFVYEPSTLRNIRGTTGEERSRPSIPRPTPTPMPAGNGF